MKHLLAKEHLPHLKKRAILEIIGFLVLLSVCYRQADFVRSAFETVRNSDLFYMALLLSTYWLLLPLTPISYQLLSKKRISLWTTSLAQLAGSGAGRIIPGGLGHMSISTVHLTKIGIRWQNAILITVTNNIIGLLTNISLVIVVLLSSPELFGSTDNETMLRTATAFVIGCIMIVTAFFWLSHARATKKTIKNLNKQRRELKKFMLTHPKRFTGVIGMAVLITCMHAILIMLSAKAIGVSLRFDFALLALSSGVFIGGVIPSPGGLGAVEAGIAGALILLGLDETQAISIAIIYRVATYWQPLIPGVISYLYLREKKLL